MVLILGVVSWLFLSHIALVSANEVVPRILGVKRNNIVERQPTCAADQSEAYSI